MRLKARQTCVLGRFSHRWPQKARFESWDVFRFNRLENTRIRPASNHYSGVRTPKGNIMNPFEKRCVRGLVIVLALAMLIGGSVQASTIVSPQCSPNELTYDSQISATDLINLGQPSYISMNATVPPVNAGTGLAFGNNGTHDGAAASYATDPVGAVAKDTWYLWTDPSTTLTYTLNTNPLTGGSAAGYDITAVKAFAGWQDADLFQSHLWTLRVATLTNPIFTDVQSVNYIPNSGSKSSMVSITDSTGKIASGVTAVQFYVQQPGGLGIVFREIDVLGTASVPEPGTLGLLAVAAMSIVGYVTMRRRHV
jgi:hypothetical protein